MTLEPTPMVPGQAPGSTQGQAAPPTQSRLPVLVIIAGLFSTVVTLAVVWYISSNTEQNLMGWYANYVIPVGALLVGLGAAAGYGIASWVTGVKIRRGLLVTILLLQLVAYFAAQYIEFRMLGELVHVDTNKRVTFVEYFHYNAVSFAWMDKKTGEPGQPLGMWGYAFRLLELAGFAFGGLIVPMVLMNAPYCDSCEFYKKTRLLTVIPASAPPKEVKKGLANNEEEARKGQEQLDRLLAAARSADGPAFTQQLATLEPGKKAAEKLPARIQVSLVFCKTCSSGTLNSELVTAQGNQVQRTVVSTDEVPPQFVEQINNA